MVDGEEKYVLIQCKKLFDPEFWIMRCFIDPFWQLDPWQNDTFWLSPEDYEFYTPYEIQGKMIEKMKNKEKKKIKNKIRRLRMTEKSLIDLGYIRVATKEETWGYDWILQEAGWWDLRKIFSKKEDTLQLNWFYDLAKQLYLKAQIELIWTWLETDLLVKWCEENQIPYRLDISPEFSAEAKDQAIEEIRERVRQWSRDNRFTGELQVLNRNELGRKLQ